MAARGESGQRVYWEAAGIKGYASQMFASVDVAQHVNRRLWNIAVGIGLELGLGPQSRVLDLGCGDGAFANQALAPRFMAIDGFDFADAAIERARAHAPNPQVHFAVCDITQLDFSKLPRYDGAFLIGILHHVKRAAPRIVRSLRDVTSRLVVLEPNGDNIVRKLLELTPSYRAAGEDSFRTRELSQLVEAAGFRRTHWRRLNLFPNFTPRSVFKLLRPIEPAIEGTPLLRALCTVNVFGFVVDSVTPA